MARLSRYCWRTLSLTPQRLRRFAGMLVWMVCSGGLQPPEHTIHTNEEEGSRPQVVSRSGGFASSILSNPTCEGRGYPLPIDLDSRHIHARIACFTMPGRHTTHEPSLLSSIEHISIDFAIWVSNEINGAADFCLQGIFTLL